MECLRVSELITDYSVGLLEGRQLQAMEAHLDRCAACRAELDELNQVMAAVELHGGLEPPTNLWVGIQARIEGGLEPALEPALAPRRASFWERFRVPRWALGAAAGGVAAAGLAFALLFNPRPPEPTASIGNGALWRQHALTAAEEPLGDRAAWEAQVILSAQSVRGRRESL